MTVEPWAFLREPFFPRYWLLAMAVYLVAFAARIIWKACDESRKDPDALARIEMSKNWSRGVAILLNILIAHHSSWWLVVLIWGFLDWRDAGYPHPQDVGIIAVIYGRHAYYTVESYLIWTFTVRFDPLNISWLPITAPKDLRVHFMPGEPRIRAPLSYVIMGVMVDGVRSEKNRRAVAYFYRRRDLHTITALADLFGNRSIDLYSFDLAPTESTVDDRLTIVDISVNSVPTWGRLLTGRGYSGTVSWKRIEMGYIGLDVITTGCSTQK